MGQIEAEESRLREAYARRTDAARYSWFRPDYRFTMQSRERATLELLNERFDSLEDRKILEVGCGRGQWLIDFVKWGARPEHLTGIDLLADRIEAARQACPAGITLKQGSATRLDSPDSAFDIVLQSTVFSSILDDTVRRLVAAEMWRVLRPGGFIIWYDFHVSNPRNPDVRGVTVADIRRLFPSRQMVVRRITLAPPIARILAPHLLLLCHLLKRIPWFCTHYLAVISKDESGS